ncbi:hypothetical protein BJ165DRAFT_1349733 [Panaeolus papilionaceus]|nr:hypothetical protein BJ165DRAFT_1349733 [Panaeolus papilionaceus]
MSHRSGSALHATRKAWSEEQFNERRAQALGSKIDHSTWKSYTSGFRCWKAFVELHNYPLRPTPLTMSNFILYMSEFIKPSSVSSYLTAIIHFLRPRYPDVCEVRQSSLVNNTLHGCKRLHGSAITRKNPLTVDMISVVIKTLAFSFDDILFKAMLAVGFSALLRLGDISDPDNPSLKNPRKRSLRSSVNISPDSVSYVLPAHKADKYFEGNTLGIPPHLIQAAGRWSSDAWKIYIRTHPLLLAALPNTAMRHT